MFIVLHKLIGYVGSLVDALIYQGIRKTVMRYNQNSLNLAGNIEGLKKKGGSLKNRSGTI